MSDNVVSVKLEASYGQFQSAFEKAKYFVAEACGGMKDALKGMSDEAKVDSKNYESTVEQFGNIVQNRFKGVNGAIAGVKTMWAQLGVVIGAGMAAAKAIDDASKYTTEMQKLAKGLGITTNSASGLAMALGDVHGSSDEFLKLAKGIDTTLRKNEKAMNDMGLATRDANGDFKNQKDLVVDALEVLRGYKEGTDRNLAAQTLFGQGVQANAEIMALSNKSIEEGQKKAEALNVVVGTESVEANAAYRQAMGDVNDVMDAMMLAVGNALMPVLTELAGWFAEIGPTAVLAIRASLAILISLFRGLAFVVKAVYEIVAAAFISMADYASVFGEVLSNVLSGNWAEAQAASSKFLGMMGANFSEAFKNISADARETSDAIVSSFTGLVKPASEGTAESGGKDYVDTSASDKNAKKAASEAAKAQREREAAMREEFKAFQDAKRMELETAEQTYAERLRIAREVCAKAKALFGEESSEFRKASLDIVKIEKELAAERARIKEVQKQSARDAALFELEVAEQNASYLLATGQATEMQRIQMQIQFEEQRFQIQYQYLEERLAMLNIETEAYAVQLAQMQQLKQSHDLKMQDLAAQASVEQITPFQDMMASMKEGWAQNIAMLITGQQTMRQALNNILKQMLASFVQYLTQKLAAHKVFATLEIAVGKMIAAVLRILGIQSATQAIGAKSTETAGKIGQSAAAAGAGAAESQASIPIIGPVLAIGAMAMIFAAVMAMKGKGGGTPSAAGGWDIPAGLNPLTQLHAQEMVLPAEQAGVIRDMANNGGAGGAMNVHIHATDADSFKRLLLNNNGAVAEALRKAVRNGAKY